MADSYAVTVTKIKVPGNPGIFKPAQFIKDGMPGFKGVGKKLLDELQGEPTAEIGNYIIEFSCGRTPVKQKLPSNLRKEGLNAWTLYQFLVWPRRDLVANVPTGAQLGCLLNLFKRQLSIRVQIDWEAGHNIGLRPSEPGWTWKPGTFFAIPGYE